MFCDPCGDEPSAYEKQPRRRKNESKSDYIKRLIAWRHTGDIENPDAFQIPAEGEFTRLSPKEEIAVAKMVWEMGKQDKWRDAFYVNGMGDTLVEIFPNDGNTQFCIHIYKIAKKTEWLPKNHPLIKEIIESEEI
jgi:hypothetical protein